MPNTSPIRSARISARLTQAQLAKRLRITKASVSDWERGRTFPNRERVPELIRALHPHLSLPQLFQQAA